MLKDNNLRQHSLEHKCFSWRPVLVGAFVAIGLSFLLNLFSVAIGLTAFTTNSEGIENLMMGGLVATALGIVVSMFASGWLAGYLAKHHCEKRHLGALYGFLAWCVALIISVFLADHFAKYVTFYSHFISGTDVNTVSVSAKGVEATVKAAIADKAVISTYIVFCLFFLSALAASFGGHCGMRHRCKEEGQV